MQAGLEEILIPQPTEPQPGIFRRHKKKWIGGILLSGIIGLHALCGAKPHHVTHESEIYFERATFQYESHTFTDCEGKTHDIDIYGDKNGTQVKLLQKIIATLPSTVVKPTTHIRFVDEGLPGRCGDAHLLYNTGVICVERDVKPGTIVHEFYHQAFNEISYLNQYSFSKIGKNYFRESIIPVITFKDHWKCTEDLPEGKEGAAFGFVTHYAGKNVLECAAECGEAYWAYTHAKQFPTTANPYLKVLKHKDQHNFKIHKKRYAFFDKYNLLSDNMKKSLSSHLNEESTD